MQELIRRSRTSAAMAPVRKVLRTGKRPERAFRSELFNGNCFVMLLLQFGCGNVSPIPEGRSRGNGMEGRELRQSVEEDLFLLLSNPIVQMLRHCDRTNRVIDDFGHLQVLLGDDDLRKVTAGLFRLISRLVSDDNVWTLGFSESLSLGAFDENFFLAQPGSSVATDREPQANAGITPALCLIRRHRMFTGLRAKGLTLARSTLTCRRWFTQQRQNVYMVRAPAARSGGEF